MASSPQPGPAGVRVRVPAKINLALKVGAPRADGYHPLATVYQAVSVYDEVHAAWADPDEFEVVVSGGQRPTGLDAVEWARSCEASGAGELLPTSMDGDGTLAGYDLPFTRAVAEAVNIPVIASGGAGSLEHFYKGVVEGKASALLAASVFHFRTFTVGQVKEYLASRGIPVLAWESRRSLAV